MAIHFCGKVAPSFISIPLPEGRNLMRGGFALNGGELQEEERMRRFEQRQRCPKSFTLGYVIPLLKRTGQAYST